MTFRKLKANEIDCRVASVASNGSLMLLLYKDARVDQNILDETFGIFGWQRKHELIGGNLYCTVSVQNPDTKEWVSKQDVGTESFSEKEKGQASDSFKRACFNLGIGRELYTAPTIWINKGDYTSNEKGNTYDRFTVKEIGYDDDGSISHLVIENQKLKRVVFTTDEKPKKSKKDEGFPSRDKMLEIVKKHYPDGSDNLAKLLKTFEVASVEECSDNQLKAIYSKYGGE